MTNGDGPGEDGDDASTGHGRVDGLLRATLGRPPDPVGAPGRYVDLRDPKRGGMAVVYRATDVELGREVAYKVMDDDLGDPERDRRLFAREAEITARLQYPGIVPVFGRVTDGSRRSAYAMGYIEGIDFKALALQGRPLRDRLAAFRDACRIVKFAHGRGYAHCDISLKNLMIADDGATHVVDWGLARRVDRAGPRDEAAESVGFREPFTPGFTPPSVRAGGPKTFATDVYGLGAVLAALVLGVTPQGQPDFDGPGAKSAPRAIRAIIGAAMADRADGPYPTAGDLADDVGRYLDGERVRADAEPWVESVWRSIRKHPSRATVAVSSVLLLSVTVASAASISAARDRAATSEEKGRRQEQEARLARREALWSQANEAMLRCDSILNRNPPPELVDLRMIEPILKGLAALGKKPDLPTTEAIESVRSHADVSRQLKARSEARGREAAESELRKVIATLERLGDEVPEPQSVRFHLAKSYYGLGTLELTRVTNELGLLKYLFITQKTLAGKPPNQPEVEKALAKIQRGLELIPTSSPPPSEPDALRELERESWTVRGMALARLGRFTECLISLDRALPLARGPVEDGIRKLRLIFLVPAEVEQSHMPWSPPNRGDHDRAIQMADYLAGQPNVSPAAVFNAACAFSLASLDERAGEAERGRRASRAVTLLALIEGKGYFRESKQAKELREDQALDPLRQMSDFQALATRVAKGG